MVKLARKGKTNLAIREVAAELVNEIPERNWNAEINAIFCFVRDNIRYTLDVDDTELLQQADYTLDNGFGDCDDKSILLAALLGSIGHSSRFVAIGYRFGEYAHVFLEARGAGEGNWIALDTTEDVPMGWRPPGPYAMRPMIMNVSAG